MRPVLVYTNYFLGFWFLVWLGLGLTIYHPKGKVLGDALNTCYYTTPNEQLCSFHQTLNSRGYDYFLNGKEETMPNGAPCLCYGWNISHFLVHMVSGLLFPEFWKEQVVLGIVFECIEFPVAHDTTDIICNTLGMVTGLGLSAIIHQK